MCLERGTELPWQPLAAAGWVRLEVRAAGVSLS
jgi:hypothetical protein